MASLPETVIKGFQMNATSSDTLRCDMAVNFINSSPFSLDIGDLSLKMTQLVEPIGNLTIIKGVSLKRGSNEYPVSGTIGRSKKQSSIPFSELYSSYLRNVTFPMALLSSASGNSSLVWMKSATDGLVIPASVLGTQQEPVISGLNMRDLKWDQTSTSRTINASQVLLEVQSSRSFSIAVNQIRPTLSLFFQDRSTGMAEVTGYLDVRADRNNLYEFALPTIDYQTDTDEQKKLLETALTGNATWRGMLDMVVGTPLGLLTLTQIPFY